MTRNLLRAAVLAIALGAALPAFADTHRFVYYDHDVYYAPHSHMYYWRENGEWREGRHLSRHYRHYARGRGFSIDLDVDRPWERHDFVVDRYRHRRHHRH
jgi:hypothetical protein